MLDADYYRPETTADLAELLQRTGGKVIAGGTDVIPRSQRGQFLTDCLIDISRLKDLRFIRSVDGQIQIGALTTHNDLAGSPLLQAAAPALVQAAATIGCPQTRQRGTLGGNLANASPAADTAPPLLALDARLRLVHGSHTREVPLCEFFTGPGKTSLLDGEYIERIAFQQPAQFSGSAFYKLGKRSGMAISIVSAAVSLEMDASGIITAARVALGSVAPTPIRSPHAEQVLTGQIASQGLFEQAGQAARQDISPIGDVRAPAEYRAHAAAVVIQRVLDLAVQATHPLAHSYTRSIGARRGERRSI
ncbi:MAG: xanthine dehydrogenase family protein subunit M [Anaerolineaceae bacterium]|nr:xanthine dehydrogenase family protein subunit M [Anaerolineaceae bacterium]